MSFGKRKNDHDMTGWALAVVIAVMLAAAVGDAWYSSVVYGDWTCAISRCVRVKP